MVSHAPLQPEEDGPEGVEEEGWAVENAHRQQHADRNNMLVVVVGNLFPIREYITWPGIFFLLQNIYRGRESFSY